MLVGLAIAVANIDEVIKLIRFAPSPADAKDQLMARDWPAKDMAPLIELIADPRHKVLTTARIGCQKSRPRPSSNCVSPA